MSKMKKSFLFIALIMLAACSKKQENFELLSAESFAYSVDNGWEITATVRAKGFEQNENKNVFTAKVSYTVDLKTPDGKLFENIKSGVIDKTANEKIADLPIEVQLQLNSNSKTGNYKIWFYVKDELSGRKANLWSFCEVSK